MAILLKSPSGTYLAACCAGWVLLVFVTPCPAAPPIEVDRKLSFQVQLTEDSPVGEASIREHAIAWHPLKHKYYLVADVVPLSNPHHPNTYNTEIHLWSSRDLMNWEYHGVAVEKGEPTQTYDGFGVASPAGMAFAQGELYVAFSARQTERFSKRGIGLAWSGVDPEKLPWTKSAEPVSDLEGEDDDPALLSIPGDQSLHLYHRSTGPGGYQIVHTSCPTPKNSAAWPTAQAVTPRPATVRAQELTGAFFSAGKIHLLVIEHFFKGSARIAHLAGDKPGGPFRPADPGQRYLNNESQADKLAYGGHITPVIRNGQPVAFFWTVRQGGQRYGLLGHPRHRGEDRP